MSDQKTIGLVEDTITKKVITFFKEVIGVGPKEAKTYIIDDMILVRLKSRLLPIEQKLLQGENGRELVKNIRQSLHELTVGQLNKIISEITHQEIISVHSDISTKTGEIVQIFVLKENYQKKLASGNL